MKKIIQLLFILSLFCSSIGAQVNIDTPNLSFDDGSFNNWSRSTGFYYYTSTDDSFNYSNWSPVSTSTINRFSIGSNTYDKIVACDLLNSPTNKNAARIGLPHKTEGNTYANGAAAEKLSYKFKVTENTTLLSYKLAAVLNVPNDDKHSGNQLPSYEVTVEVKDNAGNYYWLPCNNYSSKADFSNPQLIRNKTKIDCKGTDASTPENYQYQPWITSNIDLSKHIGDSVTIIIINHDCLVGTAPNINAGGHEAYGYFWAQTSKIELSTFSCENSDATIYAPQGFSTYNWTRSDAKPITILDPTRPYIVSIDRSLNVEGVVYSCEMNDATSACGSIVVSSTISPAKLHPDFTNVAIDAGKIQFTDISTAEGDTITNYYWDFGDGSFSALKNPIHTYTNFIPFNVKLTVTSKKGCTHTNSHNVLPTKELIATITPPANMVYNGQTKDFTATTNIAGLQMNIDYYIRYTNKPNTPNYNSYTAPSTAGDYNATFELSYLSLLKYYMTTTPTQDFTISKAPLKVTVDDVVKTYGEKITLLREAFIQDMKPLYAGDKIYELDLICNGLADTASVGFYTIIPTKAIGLGVENYDISFVAGKLTVNQKLMAINAIDNTKTYGSTVSITGKEFYIAPQTFVGNDTVMTVSLQCAGFNALANVGTYTIKASNAVGNRLSNYKISYNDASLVINKKIITVTAKALSKVYGTEYSFSGKEFDTDFSQFVGNDSILQIQFASSATPLKAPVGEYNLSIVGISGNRLDNYDIKQINSKFKVIPMDITITPKDLQKEYSDLLIFNGREFVTNKPMVMGDTISFVLLKSSGSIETAPIGAYDIMASLAYGAGTLNYNITYALGKLTVVKKQLIAAIYPPAYLGYNGQTKDFSSTVSLSGMIQNADYYIRYTNRTGTALYNSLVAPSTVGDYAATFELSSASLLKYYLANTISTDFTIAKAPLTITVDDVTKTYGDNVNLIKTAFKSDMKPLFGNDKIYELEMTCNGLIDTASVGIYPIISLKENGSGMENYAITFVAGKLTVSPKPLVIKALDVTKTYGDLYTATGTEFYVDSHIFVGNDTVSTVNLSSGGFMKTATVGSYPIVLSTVKGRRLNNYQISYSPANVTISKKKVNVSAKSLSKIYGSPYTFSGKEFDVDFSQFVGADSVTSLNMTSSATPPKASVGDYSISITNIIGKGLENYDIKLINNIFRITPMAITVIAKNVSKEYGAQLVFNGNEFNTDKPLVTGDTITFAVLKSSGCVQNAPIGDNDIFISQAYGVGTMNYDFTYQSGKLTVLQRKLTVILYPPAFLGYNGQNKDFSATLSISGLIQNTHYFIRYTNRAGTPFYNSVTAPAAAGDYTATFELSSVSMVNYYFTSTVASDFTVTRAPLTITADDIAKMYGDNTTLIKTAFKTDVKPLFGNDKIYELELTCNGLIDTASVKIYPIIPLKVNGSGMENYVIIFVAGKLTVNPKPLLIKAFDATKTYGDLYAPIGTEFYVDSRTFVGNDTVSSVNLSSGGYIKTATVGSYPIAISTAKGRRLNNYQISYSAANMTVVKKKINVSAKSLNKIYGNEYTFSGKEFDVDFSQLAGKDSVTSLTLTSPATSKKASVGDYSISVVSINGKGLENYEIKLINNIFRITPVAITVTAKNVSKEYGLQLAFNGNEFSTDKPLANGDTVSFAMLKSIGCDQNASIGDYDIFISQAYGVGTMNYDFTYLNGKLTVVQKKLIATLYPPAFLGYNAQKKEFSATLSISGLIQNTHYFIRYTNRTGTPSYNSLTAPSAAGNYTAIFELSSQSALQYNVDKYPSEDFTITKALLTITADNGTKTYGSNLNLLKDAYKSDLKPLYGSDKIFEVEMSCNGLIDTVSVGTYSITPVNAIGDGLVNYDIHFNAGTLTVTPKALLVKALDATKTYGDKLTSNNLGFYVDKLCLVGSDVVSGIIFTSAGCEQPAVIGTYLLKASGAVGQRMNNYQITYSDATLQVVKKKITVSAKPLSKVYGSNYLFRGNEFISDSLQLVGNDKINSVKLNSQAVQMRASVGEYNLSITDVLGFRLDNYDIKMVSSQFEVTPLPIIVTAKDMEKEYTDVLTFTGNEFTTNIPLVNGDTISYVFMRSTGSAGTSLIGEYDIIPSQSLGAGSMNYKISYNKGKLKVIQKQLSVNALSCVKEYGENDPEFVIAVVDKRGVEYLPSLFSGKVVRQQNEQVGTYAIKQGTLSIAPSYSFAFSEGQLTIKKALPFIDTYFTNQGGQFVVSNVSGTKNGDAPQGSLKLKIVGTSIDKSTGVINGKTTCSVSNLPTQMAVVQLEYQGDNNYLPTSKILNIYAVVYETNGGTLISPITNFDGSESFILETPSHSLNFKFEGWYETPNFSGDPIKRIPIGTTHDIYLYARWSVSYEDLSIVPLFNQVLAVANPGNHDFIYKSTYKWYKDGVELASSKQYCGFDNYIPTGVYRVEIYYQGSPTIILELNYQATIPMSKVYPNPMKMKSDLTLSTSLVKDEGVTVEVFNAIGIKQSVVQIQKFEDRFKLSGFVNKGVHLIRVMQNGQIKETHKVIVEE